ncbi:MAG: SDR family oxidoreductase, partial [Elusimicrobia bacterium]|nr:SDR family oxidoreductase [Elusimicrobiota bacterium]
VREEQRDGRGRDPALTAAHGMILILGGKGFVGSAFARWCERGGREFRVVTRADYASHVGTSCDVLINAAGNSSKPLAAERPLADFEASVLAVRRSLEDFRPGLYVHISSCDVYPDCSSPAATAEDAPLPPARQSAYGFHKRLAELCVMNRAPRWLVLRAGGFVGPGLRKNAVFDILNGGPLWLDPSSELQYLSTDAAAALAMTLVEKAAVNEVFNLCGDGTVRLEDIARRAGRKPGARPGSPVKRYDVSLRKLKEAVPVPRSEDEVFRFVDAWKG